MIKGCVITIDAMGCQKEIAGKIIDKEGNCILALKNNKQHLSDELKEAFCEREPQAITTQTEIGHGRIEKRTCKLISDIEWVCKATQWKALKSLIEISTERTDKTTGETQRAARYYISSLQADAKKFNEAVRERWGIENNLHWCLDVVFNDDSSQKSAGNAAENFAIITRIALNLIKNDKTKKTSMKINVISQDGITTSLFPYSLIKIKCVYPGIPVFREQNFFMEGVTVNVYDTSSKTIQIFTDIFFGFEIFTLTFL
jgi:predicted transposase YbfD/YdcC